MNHLGRKLYHVTGGAGLLSVYYLLGREQALLFYAVFFIAVLGLDILRIEVPNINTFIFSRFGSFIRKSEKQTLTGTAYYVIGIGLTFLVYSRAAATVAICFLIFGDVAATTIGERFGKTKIGSKSLEGTAAFVIAAFAVGGVLYSIGLGTALWVMIPGALVAAGVELLTLPVNDNLVIPVVSGGVMEFLLRAAG